MERHEADHLHTRPELLGPPTRSPVSAHARAVGAATHDLVAQMTARELVLLTKADAEGLLDALATVEATPPSDAASLTQALTVASGQLDARGWGSRAADLSAALANGSGGWPDGCDLELAWRIHNDIVDTCATWPPAGGGGDGGSPPTCAVALAAVARVRPHLTSIVAAANALCLYREVRGKLKKLLAKVAVGKAVSFATSFGSCVPDSSTRAQLLQQLSNDTAFCGAVDVTRGVIYRTPASRRARWLTYLSPAVFFLAAGGVVVGISALHGLIGGLPTQLWGSAPSAGGPAVASWHKLLGPYVLVCAGAVAHLSVESVKQGQADNPPIAIGDLLTWLQLRWAGLALSFVHVVVAVVGLSVLGVGDTGHDLTLWLAAGYSVDSVAGLILNRFGTSSKAATSVSELAAG
jgi:hypothetical protein